MSTRTEILKVLADGDFHSGTAIGESLNITRAAVNKCVQALVARGLEIHRVSGQGYKLATPFTPLSRQRIERDIQTNDIRTLHILDEVDSTSRYLLSLAADNDVHGHVCLAECQTRGRGRRGRQWMTSPYSNVILSLGWTFPGGPGSLAGLSLVVGVALVQALADQGIEGIELKWPNDLLWQGRKLGGVLVDLQGEVNGPSLTILGIGINVRQQDGALEGVDQPWVDISRLTDNIPDRNVFIAAILNRLTPALEKFKHAGFEPFREDWTAHHAYHDQDVTLIQGNKALHGRVRGVDEHGALLLIDSDNNAHVFHSGEVSLRPH
ncbi:MAG: bifunctional biotin--[acetyl-CoA-carboxylase] ligase/biotin operon repressor BirA [Gammaproteobacteria bacterium]|nr:MAG: bifunctional biotin--[acetyl-CoA-carboxylase] ligase/biotin operon repressor BirA [Gammaproteobacteria bacterium]